jgi:hypothetical protein
MFPEALVVGITENGISQPAVIAKAKHHLHASHELIMKPALTPKKVTLSLPERLVSIEYAYCRQDAKKAAAPVRAHKAAE